VYAERKTMMLQNTRIWHTITRGTHALLQVHTLKGPKIGFAQIIRYLCSAFKWSALNRL